MYVTISPHFHTKQKSTTKYQYLNIESIKQIKTELKLFT